MTGKKVRRIANARSAHRLTASERELLTRFRNLSASGRESLLLWAQVNTRLQASTHSQDRDRAPLSARAARQMAELRMEWNEIQNRANVREARRMQKHGRYSKADTRRLDELMTHMEALKGGTR
jgi:hypothetical protein